MRLFPFVRTESADAPCQISIEPSIGFARPIPQRVGVSTAPSSTGMDIDLPRLRAQREAILRLAASHGASNVRIFGSIARRDGRSDRDINVLVDMRIVLAEAIAL